MSLSNEASENLQRMIKREQEIMDAAGRLRASARNKTVRSQCDSQIAEAARNVEYLRDQLSKLTVSSHSVAKPEKKTDVTSNSVTSAKGADNEPVSKDITKPNGNGKITRLDLFRWDRVASMGPRIRLMLQQIEYKLSIEQQYERGTRKLINLYGQAGDRRVVSEAEANLAESRSKMALLKRSQKRYADMNLASVLGNQDDENEEFAFALGAPNVRRPLTGLLRVIVERVEGVDHTIAWADQVTMWITMKVENNSAATAQTRPTRSSQFHEDFTIPVDKGNEIEFTVYDRRVASSSDSTLEGSAKENEANPVALMWLRISDIAEAIRQKRVERELKRTGWASAEQVQAQQVNQDSNKFGGSSTDLGLNASLPALSAPSGDSKPSAANSVATPANNSAASSNGDPKEDIVEGWFTLEPTGRVFLRLGFEKTGGNKRAKVYNDLAKLGRHNAIRKREETQQVHGHEFELYQAYNIVRCAVCGDFTTSYCQCQECHLTCDRKCMSRVVTKCTALMSEDPDEEELNHRIPHHFEPTSNMKASWCAQCGFILPLASRKNVRKCTECGIMVHLACSKYVPDLCGMSMETAAQVVNEINSTRIRQATKAAATTLTKPRGKTSRVSPTDSTSKYSALAESSSSGKISPQKTAYGQTKTPSVVTPQPGPVKRKQVPGVSVGGSTVLSNQSSAPTASNPLGNAKVPGRTPAFLPPVSGTPVSAPPTPAGFAPHKQLPPTPAGTAPTQPPSGPPTGTFGYSATGQQIGYPGATSTAAVDSLKTLSSQSNSTPSGVQSSMVPKATGIPEYPYPSHVPASKPSHLPSSQSPSAQTVPQKQSQSSSSRASSLEPEIPPKNYKRQSLISGLNAEDAAKFAEDAAAQSAKDAALHESARQQAQALLSSTGSEASNNNTSAAAPQASRRRRRKVGLDDFSFLAVLGKGNFGKVMLAESNHTGQLYAVKVLKKNFIIENREVESTRSEKRVFLIANRERHPFLVNLSACFQTENRIYFVMDYVSGGDLMFHIQQKMFSAKRAQFYAAEVLLALKHFHDNDVIYRDLKLDNILLSTTGHIKIADYGLCKENMGLGQTTGTFCGTPDFIAPEILMDQKYGRSVDWWALGVLMYQMLLGKSPFHGNDEDEVYDAILNDEPLYPIHMPRDSVSILQQLLTRDPQRRLGSGPKGALEIMAHPYFANINFDDLLALRIEPPYKPELDSPTDVRYFERDFTSEMPALTPMNSTLNAEMQEEFRGFSYNLGDSV